MNASPGPSLGGRTNSLFAAGYLSAPGYLGRLVLHSFIHLSIVSPELPITFWDCGPVFLVFLCSFPCDISEKCRVGGETQRTLLNSGKCDSWTHT
jgi:hypothetical protein